MTRNKKIQMSETIIKINTKTVHELRSIAEDKGRRDYYKFKRADLNALV